MSNLTQLRLAAREIFDEALRAADAGDAVRRTVQFTQHTLSIGDLRIDSRRVYAIAFGKAAPAMAVALNQILGESLAGGVLVDPRRLTLDQEILLPKPWLSCHGGHPLPTHHSLAAAERALELLDRANAEHALVIFLVSGGGSAMIEWPISGEITLGNIRMANKALVACGASISEINAVRRSFSFIKGGRLAAKAPNCDQVTLIVSDVPAGEEWNVASGPTLSPPKDAPDPLDVLERYDLRGQMPAPILRAIEAHSEVTEPSNVRSTKLREHRVLLDNGHVLEAAASAARHRGYTVEIARDISDQPIGDGCEDLLNRLNTTHATAGGMPGAGVCVISGGEFACPVRGDGIGGRNLESALRMACSKNLSLSDTGNFVALCAGTDGIDGNSPAAGAIIDSTTIERATRIGVDPQDFLDRSDSYSFFVALGDVIATGPTGTNVRDLRILLRGA